MPRQFHPLNRSHVYSNEDWLEGLINKDEEMMQEAYARYFDRIRLLVLRNHGREEDARDVFQDVLLTVFQKAREGTLYLTSSFDAYLYAVSRLQWLRELRRRRRFSSLDEDTESSPSSGHFFDRYCAADQAAVIRNQMKHLSEDCRRVLLLFEEGYTIAEITRLMGYRSEQHTRNRRYRCKQCLMRKVREAYRLST